MNPLCSKIIFLILLNLVISCSRDKEVIASPHTQAQCINDADSDGDGIRDAEKTPLKEEPQETPFEDASLEEPSFESKVEESSEEKEGSDTNQDITGDEKDNCPFISNPAQDEIKLVDSGYWKGVKINISETPNMNKVAVSCHNCYSNNNDYDSNQNLEATLKKINSAIDKKADLIELDVKDEGGIIYVKHDDAGTSNGARLEDLLWDCKLKMANQPLYIEIKESVNNTEFAERLVNMLIKYDYIKDGRPLFLRAFHNSRDHLTRFRELFNREPYTIYKQNVRLHELISYNDVDDNKVKAVQGWIDDTKKDEFHGVEFEYTINNLFALINYAKEMKLAVGIWTIPETFGEVFIASLREKVDQFSSNYSVDKAKSVITEGNKLQLLDIWDKQHISPEAISVNTKFEKSPKGEDMYGNYCIFDSSLNNYISFNDLDAKKYNDYPNVGHLVSVLVNFDNLDIEEGVVAAILTKAEYGGFALELNNENGEKNTELRFGVYVNGKYHYATYPASALNMTDSYFITGAYDGDGDVWMWIDNKSAGVTKPGTITGDVESNNVPITIGADPNGDGTTDSYFSGKVQFAQVLSWQNH